MPTRQRSARQRRRPDGRLRRIAVPLAIPVALAAILGAVIAVAGGNHATNVNQSALDNCASPSASASAAPASPAAPASAPAPAAASAPAAPCPSATASTNVVATASPSAPAVNPEAGRPGLAMTNPVDPTGAAINLNQTAAEAAASLNCTLTVPVNPLSAQGLATPWQLGDGCGMANAAEEAFVEATILAPNGKVQIYDPLVITQGTTPLVAPAAPKIARGSRVIINTGFNGNNLVLMGAGAAQGGCIDAFGNSIIAQTAACNARAFYTDANAQLAFGRLRVPRIGTASDGKVCETTESFSLIDQDQSDNVVSQYLLDANGNTAQNTAANKAAMGGATVVGNGSDDALLAHFIDPALGCKPLTATDTTSASGVDSSQALNALSARMNQRGQQALLPVNDPQLLVGGQFSIGKTNTFRMMNDQPLLSPFTNKNQDAATYCQNMVDVQAPKLQLDAATEAGFTTPVPAVGNNLATFMGARLSGSFANMNCQNFGLKDPTTVTTDGNGVATAVTYNVTPQKAAAQGGNGVHRGRHHNPRYFIFGRSGHEENGAGM